MQVVNKKKAKISEQRAALKGFANGEELIITFMQEANIVLRYWIVKCYEETRFEIESKYVKIFVKYKTVRGRNRNFSSEGVGESVRRSSVFGLLLVPSQ